MSGGGADAGRERVCGPAERSARRACWGAGAVGGLGMTSQDAVAATLCPACNGAKRGVALVGAEMVLCACTLCRGAGAVTEQTARWHYDGQIARVVRIAGGEAPQTAARRLGITTLELTDMEMGRADPARLRAARSAEDKK